MLHSNKLLIDKYCPMCRFYAAGFEKTGCVAPGTVAHYQTISKEILGDTDLERAKTEIALHDYANNQTRYGIDAMIHMATHHHPQLNRLVKTPSVYRLLKLVYQFITYNRRVMYPCQEIITDRKCIPANNPFFRLFFLLVCFGIISSGYFPLRALRVIELSVTQYVAILISVIGLVSIGFFTVSRNGLLDFWGNLGTMLVVGTAGSWLILGMVKMALLAENGVGLALTGLAIFIGVKIWKRTQLVIHA